jgi:hypothetical protein
MNVLFVIGDQVVLRHRDQTVQGPLTGLRALVKRVGARGQTILVLPGALQTTDVPPGLPEDQRLTFLDSRFTARVTVNPHVPEGLLSTHDPALYTQVTREAHAAGLRVQGLVPLVGCVLRAAGNPESAVVIHPHEDAFDTSIVSAAQLATRSQPTSGRLDLTRVAAAALSRPQSSGEHPRLIILGEEQDLGSLPGDVQAEFMSLDTALAGALIAIPPAQVPPSSAPGHVVAGFQRRSDPHARIPRSLYGGLAVALAVNGGLFVWASSVRAGNVRLEAQRVITAQQALETQTLRAANAQLAARIEQARTLTGNKGPLARDLPLLASRITELPGQLTSLSGPNTPTETDARAFGQAVDRTYDLVAQTPDPEALTRAYQSRGLTADIRDVDCSQQPCKVTFRAAPTEALKAAAPDPAVTPGPTAAGAPTGLATTTSPTPEEVPQ